jgi:FkbM family methyltransferase
MKITLLIKPLYIYLRDILQIFRLSGIKSAIFWGMDLKNTKIHELNLKDWNQTVFLRAGTTDWYCLKKVLIYKEYETPFPINARVIIDAGANIGMASLYYSRTYPNAKIIAIEPEQSNFELLIKNCKELDNVFIIKAALWGKNQKLEITDANSDKWAFSVKESTQHSSADPVEFNEVTALTIHSILRDFQFENIDILKLDIEGAEKVLFEENSESWINHIKQIAIELHDRYIPGCAKSFYKALIKHNFTQENRGENIFIRIDS